MDVPEMVMVWGRGWTVSRGLPPPTPVSGGFHLSAHALRHGLTTGVLLATADGRHLYRSLGWTQHATLAAAFVPPLTAASAPPAATPAVPPTATPAVPPTAATPSAAVPAAP